MIGVALQFIVSELNTYLQHRYQQQRDLIVLGPLVGSEGGATSAAANAIILSVTNISLDTVVRNQAPVRSGGSNALQVRRPLELNIHIMLAAGLQRYEAGLDLLSVAIGRLHDTAVFDRSNSPGLPQGLLRLAFSMLNVDYSQQSHLWGGLGAKYVPSVLYEMRMLTSDEGALTAAGRAVTGLDLGSGGGGA